MIANKNTITKTKEINICKLLILKVLPKHIDKNNVIKCITSDDIITRKSINDCIVKHNNILPKRKLCKFIP